MLALNVLLKVAEARVSPAALIPGGVVLVERAVKQLDLGIELRESKTVWLPTAVVPFLVGIVSVSISPLALLALLVLSLFVAAAV